MLSFPIYHTHVYILLNNIEVKDSAYKKQQEGEKRTFSNGHPKYKRFKNLTTRQTPLHG